MTATPPSPATLALAVERQLRGDILAGRVAPGAKLRIEHLCRDFGVGSSPVREALSRLSSEGLVERRAQRGFVVGEASLDDLADLVDTRCTVETIALGMTIAARSPDWEERLVVAVHRLSRHEGGVSRTPEWEIQHDAFHDILLEAAGPRLRRFSESLRLQANRYRLLSRSIEPSRRDLDEHRAIAEAAMAGNIVIAGKLLMDHYRQTQRSIEKAGLSRASVAGADRQVKGLPERRGM